LISFKRIKKNKRCKKMSACTHCSNHALLKTECCGIVYCGNTCLKADLSNHDFICASSRGRSPTRRKKISKFRSPSPKKKTSPKSKSRGRKSPSPKKKTFTGSKSRGRKSKSPSPTKEKTIFRSSSREKKQVTYDRPYIQPRRVYVTPTPSSYTTYNPNPAAPAAPSNPSAPSAYEEGMTMTETGGTKTTQTGEVRINQ
jgi:hypothetical protein